MIFEEKTIESEIIYKGRILTLRKDKVSINDNVIAQREIIEHQGAVAVLAITEDNRVVLVKQYRKPIERDILEIPAGKIDPGEEPIETARRELREETGYSAEKMELIYKMYPALGYSDELIYIYQAEGLMAGETEFDEDENIELIEMPIQDAFAMLEAGEIEDGKTIIGLLHLR